MFKHSFKVIIILPFFLFFNSSYEDYKYKENSNNIKHPFVDSDSRWVDSVFRSLSPDERIAQLFMIPVPSNKGKKYMESMSNFIKKYKVGGIIFFKGGPGRQIIMTNRFQKISKTPLLISIDGEWGLSMRLDSTTKFPRQMLIGAIQDEEVIYDMGVEIARQCKRIGVHVNFAPVIDVNNNPKNPVINSRSFGESRRNVASKGFAYMIGMQDNRVIATAKHFPGHGDTDTDSHKTLPIITHSRNRLDSIEIYPFKHLIDAGLGAIMIAHLYIPELDSTKNQASSLSKNIVTDILKKQLGFKGLVFTDALGMSGVSMYYPTGVTEVKALKAGVDVLLMSKSVPIAIAEIKKAIKLGELSQKDIDEKCKKILQAKYWVGLHKFKPLSLKNLYKELNSPNAKMVKRRIVESSITLLKNKNNILPIKKLDSVKIASLSIGRGGYTRFQTNLSLYANVKHFVISRNAAPSAYQNILKRISKYDIVIVGVHSWSRRPPNFGVTQVAVNFVEQLSKRTKVILDIFANPYSIEKFNSDDLHGLIMSYENIRLSQELSAQLIFGGIPARGKLPISAGKFPVYSGLFDEKIRLKYSIPKELNIDEIKLKTIDTIVMNGIKERAMPGCQIIAMKDGIVFYHKAFGHHTYKKKVPVELDHIYDLASVTKIAATTLSIMKLSDEGSFDIKKNSRPICLI